MPYIVTTDEDGKTRIKAEGDFEKEKLDKEYEELNTFILSLPNEIEGETFGDLFENFGGKI